MKTNIIPFSTKKVFLSLISIIILVISQITSQLIGEGLIKLGLSSIITNILVSLLYINITLILLNLLCKKLLKTSFRDCRISHLRFKKIWILVAFIMPILVICILLTVDGTWMISNMSNYKKITRFIDAIFYYGLAVGIVEEIVFRGIIMHTLERRWNKTIAIIIPSMIFGLIHIIGLDLNLLNTLQLFIAGTLVGILFSLITYESHSIWSSCLIHAVWNIFMVSGILNIGIYVDKYSILNYLLQTDSFLISGGSFGVEASIASIFIYFLFCLLAFHLYKKE